MSAELVGFLLMGPKEISQHQTRQGVAQMIELVESYANRQVSCPTCDTELFQDGKLVDGLDECCDGFVTVMQDLAVGPPAVRKDLTKTWTETMAKEWPPAESDVVVRADPDNEDRVLLFAGEMSDGESPEGPGYTAARAYLYSGVAEAFDIS